MEKLTNLSKIYKLVELILFQSTFSSLLLYVDTQYRWTVKYLEYFQM